MQMKVNLTASEHTEAIESYLIEKGVLTRNRCKVVQDGSLPAVEVLIKVETSMPSGYITRTSEQFDVNSR